MSLSRIVVVLEMGGWSSEVKLCMQFKSLVLKIFIVWDGCQNFQNKFKFGKICQNEFLLFGTVARSVRMNLNFGDGCQNAFLLVGTVARFVISITETVARIKSGKSSSGSRPFWQKP